MPSPCLSWRTLREPLFPILLFRLCTCFFQHCVIRTNHEMLASVFAWNVLLLEFSSSFLPDSIFSSQFCHWFIGPMGSEMDSVTWPESTLLGYGWVSRSCPICCDSVASVYCFVVMSSCQNCYVCICAKLLGDPHCKAHLCICVCESVLETALGEKPVCSKLVYYTQV